MEEPLRTAHVMVVDDDPDTVLILARHVQREGYTVIEATSGFECLRILRDRPVDVILLDLMMPEMDGFEVCRPGRVSSCRSFGLWPTARSTAAW